MKRVAFQTIRPVVSRKKRGFSAHFGRRCAAASRFTFFKVETLWPVAGKSKPRRTASASFLIWIRIILSWVRPYPRSGSFTYYMAKIVDPYLSLFRSSTARMGMLDFSPVFAVGVIAVVQTLLSVFGNYGFLTLGIILANIIYALWAYGISIFLFFSIIMLIFRTIAAFSRNPMMYNMSGQFSDPISNLVRKSFGTRIPKESTVALISLLINIALYFVLKRAFIILADLAMRIPF